MSGMTTINKDPVFVTYGWCRTAYAVVRSLGRRGIPVHIGDASRLAMSRFSKYCRSFTVLPDFFAEPEAYFEAVVKAMERTGARVLMPAHEDVAIFSMWQDQLPSDVRIAVPDYESYQAADDKYDVIALAESVGCPVPETRLVSDREQLISTAEQLGYPVAIKTRISNSAKGVAFAWDQHELEEKFFGLIDKFDLTHDRWPFLQAYLHGDPAGACALFDHGKVKAVFGEEYLRTKEGTTRGTTTLRRAHGHMFLIEPLIAIGEKLNWHGLVQIEYIQDTEGVYRINEINARLWGALWLAVAAGVDFPYLWYLLACEREVPNVEIYDDGKYCRWIVGDMLATLHLLIRGKIRDALSVWRPVPNCGHDDFCPHDPIPLLMEGVDYLAKACKYRGANPATKGMVR